MNLVTMKFGGTSIANTKLMQSAATKVEHELSLGNKVIVVISAMAGVTDHLVSLSQEITELNTTDKIAEYANIITTGEQVSAGLFSLQLQQLGIKARSWLGWQAGITTDNNLIDSTVLNIDCTAIYESFISGYQVAVVTGFQGITINHKISTLGRGGSDTTAIILSSALKAQRCDIYTDVEGVFTADPRIIDRARKIDNINYDEMMAFANAGAKVLQAKSVEWAKEHKVKLQVLSSFTSNPGTFIDESKKAHSIVGITLSNDSTNLDVAKVSIIGTNIIDNDKLIKLVENSISAADLITKKYSRMMLSFMVQEENKFSIIKQLHSLCNLD
jgi:aspartate kinase